MDATMTMKDKDRNRVESVKPACPSPRKTRDGGTTCEASIASRLAEYRTGDIVMWSRDASSATPKTGSNNTAQGRIQPSNYPCEANAGETQAGKVRARQCRGVASVYDDTGERLFTAYCFDAEWMREKRGAKVQQETKITRSFFFSQGLSLTGSIDRGLKTVIEPDLNTHSAHLRCTTLTVS